MNEMKSKSRKLRLIQAAYIVAIPLFGWVAESICGRGSSHWTSWHWLMAGLALYAAFVGFFLRRRLMRRSEETLAKDASNPKALKQWEAGHLIGFASAEAIVIWGVVVTHGSWRCPLASLVVLCGRLTSAAALDAPDVDHNTGFDLNAVNDQFLLSARFDALEIGLLN